MSKNKLFLIIKDQSERVKRKNFKQINNMPLHEYFIKNRNGWEIYIDTDSKEIIEFYSNSEKWSHVKVYERNEEHIKLETRGNVSPAPLMIERFLKEHVINQNEPIVTSHITSPFILDETIRDALKSADIYDSVSSVNQVKEFAIKGCGCNAEPINFSLDKVVKTQSLEPIGILNGAFFILKKDIFLNNGLKRISNSHLYYPVSQIESLDIDTEYDLLLAQLVAEKINENN